MTPEFSRPVAIETIGSDPHALTIAADVGERRHLAGRFGWIALDRLDAKVTLIAHAGKIAATGLLHASLTQKCVATGDPVKESVDMEFAVMFVDVALTARGGEVELNADDLDIIEFGGNTVDVGEAVAQTLALNIDPYPRSPGADAKLIAAGVHGESEVGAFARLKGLLKP